MSKVDEKIMSMVHYNFSWPDTEPRKGLVLCPYPYSIIDFMKPMLAKQSKSDLINIWTVLSINPEPLILQVRKRKELFDKKYSARVFCLL